MFSDAKGAFFDFGGAFFDSGGAFLDSGGVFFDFGGAFFDSGGAFLDSAALMASTGGNYGGFYRRVTSFCIFAQLNLLGKTTKLGAFKRPVRQSKALPMAR